MIVRESISFERGRDPKRALGLDPYGEMIDLIKDQLDQVVSSDAYDFEYDKTNKILKIYAYTINDAVYQKLAFKLDMLQSSILYNKIKVQKMRNPEIIGFRIEFLSLSESNFERVRDPKTALGLTPYVGAILKIPNNYARNNYNYLSKSHRNSHATGYELWTVIKAEKIKGGGATEDKILKIDLERRYSAFSGTTMNDVLMTLNQFEKFRDI